MIDIKKFREENNLSQKDLQIILGIAQPYISAIESGKRPLGQEKFNILYNHFGDILLKYKQPDVLISKSEELSGKGVPYFDIDITATITSSFSDVKESPEFYVDFKPFNDCTAYLPVFGDSMYPSYASGEIVAVKEVKNRNAIYWGETYLIITNAEWDNMRTIKQLHFHEDESKVILRASNPNFKGDTIIPKEAIISLYLVKGKITRKQM